MLARPLNFFFTMKPTDTLISKFILVGNYMFRAVSLPIIRSFPLYIRHWRMLYKFYDSMRAGSGCYSLILYVCCRHTCITCANAECTVENS